MTWLGWTCPAGGMVQLNSDAVTRFIVTSALELRADTADCEPGDWHVLFDAAEIRESGPITDEHARRLLESVLNEIIDLITLGAPRVWVDELVWNRLLPSGART